MTAQWLGESQPRPTTNVTFGNSRYPVCDLGAYVDVSNATLEDSAFDIPALLSFEFSQEFGFEEGKAFVGGSPILSPPGFFNDPPLGVSPTRPPRPFTATTPPPSLIPPYPPTTP